MAISISEKKEGGSGAEEPPKKGKIDIDIEKRGRGVGKKIFDTCF